VSCSALTHCMAVGTKPSATFPAWAAEWSGNRWTVERLRTGQGPPAAVSCASPTACTAVTGGYGRGSVHRWNGKKWLGNPSAPLGPLESVSCPSATVCTAVGSYNNTLSSSHTLAWRWNGPGLRPGTTAAPG
jgi:hypothetical protein